MLSERFYERGKRSMILSRAHRIARAGSLVALLLAAACQPSAAQPGQIYSGIFVWGAEVRTFAPCGQKVRYWVSGPGSVTAPLLEFYRKNTTQPYGRIYITLRGQLLDEERDGFAADYDGLLKVSQVLGMSKDAPRECAT